MTIAQAIHVINLTRIGNLRDGTELVEVREACTLIDGFALELARELGSTQFELTEILCEGIKDARAYKAYMQDNAVSRPVIHVYM